MAEKFYWADKIADDLIEQKGDKEEFVCASGITPSGKVHIGNFREVITTELVARALKDKGKKVRFIYSWDDYDRFRKVPKELPEEYKDYIGMPVSEIPSPYDENKSYAGYFEEQFENSLHKVFVEPQFIYQHKMNKKCKYAELIKTAIDNKEKIMEILNQYRKEPLEGDWLPFAVYCEKCMKDFTKILAVNDYEIEYECTQCGHKDTFDYREKGLVSLGWRVDWPARWYYEGVDFEPGGMDHSVEGGSYSTGKQISKEVYGFEAPMYQMYELIKVKGKGELSSSSGDVLDIEDVLEVYEPEILRYLFVATKPRSVFEISFDNDMIKLYDEFDKLEKEYYEGNLDERQKRIYELSKVNIEDEKPHRESFRHLTTLVQIGATGELDERNQKRAEKVKNWLEKHAGEDMKFSVQETVSDEVKSELEESEKQALIELKNSLKSKEFTEEELFNEIYQVCQKTGIKNKQFFKAAYKVIINKTKGPRLVRFILEIGKDKIIKLLSQLEE